MMQTNQLVATPQLKSGKIKYVTEVITHYNKLLAMSDPFPPYKRFKDRVLKNDWIKLFNEYVYKGRCYRGTEYFYVGIRKKRKPNVEIYPDDPLYHTNKLINMFNELPWYRFMEKKQDIKRPDVMPAGLSDVYFTIEYWEINESLISYIDQKITDIIDQNRVTLKVCVTDSIYHKKEIHDLKEKALQELKTLFNNTTGLDYDDYINQKTKQLMEINLDNYVESLNANTLTKHGYK